MRKLFQGAYAVLVPTLFENMFNAAKFGQNALPKVKISTNRRLILVKLNP